MPKSLPLIVGLGAAACLLLGHMMQGLRQIEAEQTRTSLASGIQAWFGSKLAGPARVREERVDGKSRLIATLAVRPGDDRQLLADSVGRHLWQSVVGDPSSLAEVVVVLTDAHGGPPLRRSIARPDAMR